MRPTIQQIQETVAKYWDVDPALMSVRDRHEPLNTARRAAASICMKLGYDRRKITAAFGRSFDWAFQTEQAIADRISHDRQFAAYFDQAMKACTELVNPPKHELTTDDLKELPHVVIVLMSDGSRVVEFERETQPSPMEAAHDYAQKAALEVRHGRVLVAARVRTLTMLSAGTRPALAPSPFSS
jgi:hypothetical protein